MEVGSLHPNQPGVLHVVVGADTDAVDVLIEEDVLSRQCHHPGVLQVWVRVYDREDREDREDDVGVRLVEDAVVVVIVPSNLHLKQSAHSASSGSHFGTSSYTLITSLMTPSMP